MGSVGACLNLTEADRRGIRCSSSQVLCPLTWKEGQGGLGGYEHHLPPEEEKGAEKVEVKWMPTHSPTAHCPETLSPQGPALGSCVVAPPETPEAPSTALIATTSPTDVFTSPVQCSRSNQS